MPLQRITDFIACCLIKPSIHQIQLKEPCCGDFDDFDYHHCKRLSDFYSHFCHVLDMELAELPGLLRQEHQDVAFDFGYFLLPVGEDKFLGSSKCVNFSMDDVKELVNCLLITRNGTQFDLGDAGLTYCGFKFLLAEWLRQFNFCSIIFKLPGDCWIRVSANANQA